MSEANKTQVAGTHYKSNFQHWDWVLALALPYLPAQVSRYVSRRRKKNGLQDLEKGLHCLNKFIEEEGERLSDFGALTRKFIEENELTVEEAAVMNFLAQYHVGNIEYLYRARDVLTSTIDEDRKKH